MPIDTHVHLASDDTKKYPLAEAPPIHTDGYVNTAQQLLQAMDEAKVAGAIIVQPFAIYGYDNRYHADAAARYPGRFVAVGGLSTSVPDAPAVLREWVTNRGIAGLRVNTRAGDTDFEHPQFEPLMREAARLGIPVCFLTSRRYLPAIYSLAQRMPDLHIALDHLGVQLAEPDTVLEGLTALQSAPNIVLKFSTPLFAEGGPAHRAMFDRIVERFGVDRLMWGTNYPVTNVGGYAKTVQIARDALSSLSEPEQHALFTGTALRLWPQLQPERPW